MTNTAVSELALAAVVIVTTNCLTIYLGKWGIVATDLAAFLMYTAAFIGARRGRVGGSE